MSKTVTIPRIGADPFEVRLGGQIYSYKAGSTQTVPEAVADVIENIVRLTPKNDPDIADKQYVTLGQVKALIAAAGGASLPEVTTDDNGDVLTVVSGKWAKADAPSELPAVTTDDNGDVLTVVSGKWAKADVPSELPAVSGSDNGKALIVSGGAWGAGNLPEAPFMINADGTINNDMSITITNIDKTPAQVAPIVDARKPVCLNIGIAVDDNGTTRIVQVYLPIGQRFIDTYMFAAIVTVDNEDGVSLCSANLAEDGDDAWESEGRLDTMPLTSQ